MDQFASLRPKVPNSNGFKGTMKWISYGLFALGLFIVAFFVHLPDSTANGISYYGRYGLPLVYRREWGDFGGQILFVNALIDMTIVIVVAVTLAVILKRSGRQ